MKRIAIIPSTVGYHWEELFAPFKEFKEAGWGIDLFTVDGKPAIPDPKSIEKRPLLSILGLGLRSSYSPDTNLGKELEYEASHNMQAIDQLFVDFYDAIYIPGGHGCLFDVNIDKTVHDKILEAYTKGKIVAAVCHGSSALAFVKLNGSSIIKGKHITGFPDLLDKLLVAFKWVHSKFLPLPYMNMAEIQKADATVTWIDHILNLVNPVYTLKDLPFITGVGPKAAKRVARKLIEVINKEYESVITKEPVFI